jgi:hypothetical protein
VSKATHNAATEWVSVKDRLPDPPATPYKLYLVWATSRAMADEHNNGNPHVPWGYSGVPRIVQFSRDRRAFLPADHDDPDWLVITHWATFAHPPGVDDLSDIVLENR